MKETMVALERTSDGYCYNNYSVEFMNNRWFVYDYDVQDWIADFKSLREVRSFIYTLENTSDSDD